MILAAADAAEGKGPPPPDLELAWDCQTFGGLPEAGALRDQPAGLLKRARVALNVYNSVRLFTAPPGDATYVDLANRHPREWRVYQDVLRMRDGRADA